ncbi:MAG: pyridoxal phosphate-dependent aminotransferase, partial [Planctomycetota bacterium JB042]
MSHSDSPPAPRLSSHFLSRRPSPIRQAQIRFARRADRGQVRVVNVAIGDVTRPMHPARQRRMARLERPGSPFADGVIGYGPTVGTDEARAAFLNVIGASGCRTDGLHALVTDGASQAMELMLLGVCGPAADEPVLLLDPSYTNYRDLAKRLAVRSVSLRRSLSADGAFAPPEVERLAAIVREERPRALVILPADNPTGQLVSQETIRDYARVCVEHGMWLVGDEAYRELHFTGGPAPSIWRLDEREVPGIRGRRIGIESASKVFNACGLRVGALVTDHEELHARAVAEATATLCANMLGQYVFGALAYVPHEELAQWFDAQRRAYASVTRAVVEGLEEAMPGVVVTRPEASLYAVVDVRELVDGSFRAADFVTYCAEHGRVDVDGVDHTLLVAPMDGFYPDGDDAGRTQMRLALVAGEADLANVPRLLSTDRKSV